MDEVAVKLVICIRKRLNVTKATMSVVRSEVKVVSLKIDYI